MSKNVDGFSSLILLEEDTREIYIVTAISPMEHFPL